MTEPLRLGAALRATFERPEFPGLDAGASRPGESFADLFGKAIGDTSQLQDGARDMIAAYLRGEPVELHQVMAASEEAAISLEMLVEIRNKLADAYRTVMNIQ